ncbi:protein mono-ADP-ribosyltransferase PARP4-like isoform X4 [Dunckerocampus dactyliophorus]|uniref:protein mono-ADP-ribosyltransferase PARP4-like isoform X4 n=1 Tax=Dunckerocampus dactyliophorus TaxID=161453 RepID=UPI0024049C2F|nr:protein mono-ADP-ribosyltransferase PARP4-like isoform X4 [Dunckerocampus dactyliophorus]
MTYKLSMAVFDNCTVLFELKNLSFKAKRSVTSLVTENGGKLCFVVNKQCSFVVVSDVSHLSTNRLRSIQKYQTPVVGVEYVHTCLRRGVLLLIEDYKLDTSSPSSPSLPHTLPVQGFNHQALAADRAVAELSVDESLPPEKSGDILGKFRIYTEWDEDIPAYPDDFSVAKYSIFQKNGSSACCVLELQSAKGEKGQQYRVVRYRKGDVGANETVERDMVVFPPTSEEAVEVYRTLTESLPASGLQPRIDMPQQARDLGSAPLRQLLLEEKLSAGVLSHDVGVFVELLWTEALGCLGNILQVPVNKLSLNDVSRAEGLLIQAQRNLLEGQHMEVARLLFEVYTLLPHRMPTMTLNTKLFSQKLDLCQLIRDILNVSEMTLRSPTPSSVGKFRALRCSIEAVDHGGPESRAVASLLRDSAVQIHQVLRVSRAVELQTFKGQLGNIKSLLHSSSASNFVGILSRGLLLPYVGVEHHGIDRTDAGSLGSGIYFSDSMSTCLKYAKPSATDGSRLLMVCDVALGDCMELHRKDPTLTRAPEGHDSVRAVRRTSFIQSEFEDDEYVVYRPEQVQLRYVVRFSVDGDQVKGFSPAIDTSTETRLLPTVSEVLGSNVGIEGMRNPLEDVTAGLLDSSGQQLPLQAVHVKCKLVDLLSQVIIFQKYTNHSTAPIEAKYVFPLEDSAAVCAFEAFINGKHVVAQVKEKEQARREYKQAIEKGHGAYLMDQDAPDVFTISVGNLPAGATVLIKVTFVSELIVKDGAVLFSLPGSVAPWRESAALNQTTQVTVDKVCVTDESASTREFSLDMSIEMPNEIGSLSCITHKVKMKRTDCRAVVSVLPGQVMGPDGFQLSITLSEVHLPRMWVEKHPDKDSQACMLVFYPNFDVKPSSRSDEVVILLDTSESMRGEPLRWSRVIALHIIKTLQLNFKVNIVLFNTDYTQAFVTALPLHEARQAAEEFIHAVLPVGGSTELWRPLRALSLLPPSRGIRNLLLLSDGHLQDAQVTLQLLRDNVQHSRLFTCGLSPTANQHMLRALAQAGGGAYEYFDTKSKHKWTEKVACQLRRMASPGCRSVSVKWHQFSLSAPPPVQAPKQLHALFNDCHTLVYGFVPHCTQATLLGELSGQELRTVVSTSELQTTSGTFLHKLTARALIRDYEDGSLDCNQVEHEGKKTQLKSFIVDLSKEYSILSQFTSFVAVEEREPGQAEKAFTDIPKLLAEEDVDFLPYISWTSHQSSVEEEEKDSDSPSSSLSSPQMSPVYSLTARRRLKRAAMEREAAVVMMDAESSGTETEEEEGEEAAVLMKQAEFIEMEEEAAVPMEYMESRETEEAPVLTKDAESKATEEDEEDAIMGFGLFDDEVALPEASFSSGRTRHSSLGGSFDLASHPLPPPGTTDPNAKIFPKCFGLPSASIQHDGSSDASPLLRGTQEANQFQFGMPPKPQPIHPSRDSPPLPPPLLCGVHSSSDALSGPPLAPFRRKARHPNVNRLQFGIPPVHPSFDAPPLPPPPPPPPPPPGATDPNVKELLLNLGSVPPPPLPLGHGTLQGLSVTPDCYEKAKETSIQHSQWAPPCVEVMEANVKLQQQQVGKVEETYEWFGGFLVGQASAGVSTPMTGALFGSKAPSSQGFGFGFGGSYNVLYSAPFTCSSQAGLAQQLSSQKSQSQFQSSDQSAENESSAGFSFGGRTAIKSPPFLWRTAAGSATSVPRPGAVLSQMPWKGVSAGGQNLLKWTKIFEMQISDGYWELTAELGRCIDVDLDVLANEFLTSKGIRSLGVKAHADILRLLATLVVLQLMRLEKLPEGQLLRTLFAFEEPPIRSRPARWQIVKNAVDWVRWADRQYPCVCSRLEMGSTWESVTRQLLGYEVLPALSPLAGLNLRRNTSAACPPVVVQ